MNQGARFSRTAISGACWIPFFVTSAMFLAFEPRHIPFPYNYNLPSALAILLGLTAPFGTTILGWVAVSQIRRSAGKHYGMWLAVFDGLLFPLLALDGLILVAVGLVLRGAGLGWKRTFPPTVPLSYLLFVAVLLGILLLLDWLIIRAVWRAVNKNIAAPANPPRRPRFGLWSAIACAVLLGFFGMVALRHSGGLHTTTKLADSPQDLQKATTAQVIAAALENKESPWAWQELEKRPLTAAEVAQIMDGLVAWLQRDFPDGHANPLNWLDNSLERLDARRLLTDEQKIRFLTALQGDLRIEPLPRLHEGDWLLSLEGECSWNWRRDFLGLTMMNGPISVSIDGQPLPPNKNYLGSWTWSYPRINATLSLPALAVGRHIVKVENVSALVAKEDLTGLSSTAPPSDWPPAKKRWNRAVELELNVYPRDAVLVQQTQEPALDPVRNGSLSVNPVIIRSKGSGAQATVTFNLPQKDSVPISFDVALRIGGQTIACGSLWAVQTSHGETCSGLEQSADLALPAAPIKEADIILTPNPKAIEHMPSVERIWGGQIVFSNVPLKRLDLNTAAPNLSFGPVMERVVEECAAPDFKWFDFDKGVSVSSSSLPDNVEDSVFEDWMRKTGVDVGANVTNAKGLVSRGTNFVAWPVKSSLWDSASADEVTHLLAFARSDEKVTWLRADGELPATFVFKTREGGTGILQITGFTDNPRGVKLRYKLGQPTGPQPDAAALQFRLVLPEDSTAASDRFPDVSGHGQLRVSREALLDGSAVAQAGVDFNPDGTRKIEIQFNAMGRQRFAQITATNIRHQLAVVFRGKVLCAPFINETISDGQCQIDGRMSREEVYALLDSLNRTTTASDQAWKFSAPRERSLLFQRSPEFLVGWLDLDWGTILTNSTLDWQSRAGHEWIRTNGLDVVATESSKNIPVLLGVDLVLAPAPTNGWDIITAADVGQAWTLMQQESRQEQIFGAPPGQSGTFFFQTREGGKGILQITGFSENPPGVRIRYKLVQNGDGKN